MKQNRLLLLICALMTLQTLQAQFATWRESEGCYVNPNGQCLPNTLLTSVPFLSIVPDARSGAMGDAGIGLSPDPNALHFNASKLAFVKEDFGLSTTYTPWLRELGLSDVYLAYISGFKKIDDLQSFGFGLRFFSLGEIFFTDAQGNPTGNGKPREMEISVAYARKLSSNFSAGLTAKYIYSNLASGQRVGGIDISSANAFAADISFTYSKEVSRTNSYIIGASIKNIGSKITYTNSTIKDFLPGNFGLGGAYTMALDEYNTLTFSLDFNKLLVPSPIPQEIELEDETTITNPDYDADGNGDADYREKSTFSGIFGSFTDAQGGFSEELKETNISIGAEYWYDKQFAVRAGYFYESPLKGDRQFLTVGVGLKYNIFGLNFSYLVPTNNRRNPLDNTLRFTLNYNFDNAAGAGAN